MATGDVHSIGTAKFQEVSLLPRNELMRNQTVAVGDVRYTSAIKSNLFLQCSTAGTTAGVFTSAGLYTSISAGDSINDGTAVWEVKEIGSGASYYGVCSTEAATAAKTVACSGFKLKEGASIKVKFANTNSASSPTLNVNSTGDKAIYSCGAAISAAALQAGQIYEFVYDGTNFVLTGGTTAYNIPTASGFGNIWIS